MNRHNIQHIQEKLHIDECVLMELCNGPVEEDSEYTDKEIKHLREVTEEMALMFDYDEMVSKLLNRKLCGDAFNYIDYSMDSKNRIYDVNIGLYNLHKFEIEETSVVPYIFIDILTDVTAYHISERPEEEEHLKQQFLQFLTFIEENKISYNPLR